MKSSKEQTTITISRETSEFVRDMDVFKDMKKKIRSKYYKNVLIDT
jgi:hypothetical protein